MDAAEHDLVVETFRKAMTGSSGAALDAALDELGWADLLTEEPDTAIPVVFALLGETGSHASVLNDVVAQAGGEPLGTTVTLPFTGGRWVRWERADAPAAQPSSEGAGDLLDPTLPLRLAAPGDPGLPLAAAHRALGWWLLGTGRTMLALAREHALARAQFGRPIASFQAVRHRLAETLVALEGAEATLNAATASPEPFTCLLAKAAAGRAALDAARNCQQVLAGIGFTAEHDFHHHLRRALTLDGLLGSARDLTRQAGAHLREQGQAPRLINL